MMGTLPVKNCFLEAYVAFLLFNCVLDIFGRKHNGSSPGRLHTFVR